MKPQENTQKLTIFVCKEHSKHTMMHYSCFHEIRSTIFAFVSFFLLFSPVFSSTSFHDFTKENKTSMVGNETKKMKWINTYLEKINKPFVKSINSPDGDIIDCVLIDLQPAFDHPELRGEMLLDPPELPKGDDNAGNEAEIKQVWSSNGESCPNGTIPIRRTSASDILRFISFSKFRKTISRKGATSRDHEHAVGYVTGGEFYGAKAVLNVWKPNVVGYDFSISQIWVIAAGKTPLDNTVEAGWHPNGYRSGCYNIICPGFVQTSRKISLGAAIQPVSTYNGQQFDVVVSIWKDPKSENWWLRAGNDVIGYWPKNLFTGLRYHATSIEYGGEVYAENFDKHTSTQMGSGHFPDEGFGKATYARNLEVVDKENVLKPVSNLKLLAEKPNCYNVKNEYSSTWGNYIYFGGPGNNPKCP